MNPKQDLSKMQCVIFVGGEGTRMDMPDGGMKPKTMVNVGGAPLLWHIMRIYAHYGVTKFILTLGYRGNYIKDYLKVNPGKDLFSPFEIILVETGNAIPTGGRLLKVAKYITKGTFFCTFGDGVADFNLDLAWEAHLELVQERNAIGTVSVGRVPHTYGIVTFADGKLTYEKGQMMQQWIDIGFFILTKDYLSHLSYDSDIAGPFNVLGAQKLLGIYKHLGYFRGIDTLKDLQGLNADWKTKKPWKVW